MIVSCDHCNTKFRFDADKLSGPRAKVRCSRCGNIFEISTAGETDFEEEPVFASGEPSFRKEGPSMSPGGPSRPLPSRVRKQRRLRAIFVRFVVLIALGAGLFALVRFGPDFFRPSPPAVQTPEGPRVVIDDTVEAYFLENRHAGQIFIVEGKAVNASTHPVSFVQLQGELFDVDNQVVRSARCYAGNPMTREELAGLTLEEIRSRMSNREGGDLSNVNITPESEIPFLLVFDNLPALEMLTDYSVEVVGLDEE